MKTCIIPGCKNDTQGLDICFQHHCEGFNNYNEVKMDPQPLLELNQVSANSKGQWCRFEIGKGATTPLLNQPARAVGVKKDPKTGIWYWLIP